MSSLTPPETPPLLPEETPMTAAEVAFNIPEVLQEIVQYLPKADLVNCIRLRSDAFTCVARELYHTISYDLAQTELSECKERDKVYRDSVRVVEIKDAIPLTPPIQLQLEQMYDGARMLYVKHTWGSTYTPLLFHHVSAPLRSTYKGLRKIAFGDAKADVLGGSWVANFHPATYAIDGDAGGHIDVITYISSSSQVSPSKVKVAAIPPSDKYTIDTRYDLHLSQGAWVHPQWYTALKDPRWLADIHRVLDVGLVEIGLCDIAEIYQLHAELGHPQPIEVIAASHIKPFDISELRALAKVAPTLVSLNLGELSEIYQISMDELPILIPMIRTLLPRLTRLGLGLTGVYEAELLCLKWLVQSDTPPFLKVGNGGSIQSLRIYTPDPVERSHLCLYHHIRCLAPLCARGARIHISHTDESRWRAEIQTNFLKIAHEDAAVRIARDPLVGCFSSLGISSPKTAGGRKRARLM